MDKGHIQQQNSSAKSQQLFLRQLKQTFSQMPNQISLYLFVERGRDDAIVQACRKILGAFRDLTPKITVQGYYLDHQLAVKGGVNSSPTVLIDPEHYNIRWLGAPMGEEGRSFLEAMILIGTGKSGLSEQSCAVLKRLEDARQIKVFVSPTCPYCPQQVVNGLRAAIEAPDLVSLEVIDIQSRPDLAEKYGAHSVPQAFANEVLIGPGAQQEEVFISSLLKLEPQTVFIPDSTQDLVEVDLLVVGGGPAGLTAGIYAERSGLKTALIERDVLGGQVALTPVVENYPGFTQVGGKNLVDIMVSHALQYIQIFQGEQVLEVNQGQMFEIKTTRRKFAAKAVLLATGASHRNLGAAGEREFSGRGASYCATCDGPLFKGQKVIMVGGGNSAVTEALHLHNMGVSVVLVHRRNKLRAQDVLANQLATNGIAVIWDTQVKQIHGSQQVEKVTLYNHKTDQITEMEVDGVFISIGYRPTVELAERIGVDLNARGYIRHDGSHRTNVPGIYSAGDVEGGYKQIVTATGQGAAAAMTIFEDMINPYWKKEATERQLKGVS